MSKPASTPDHSTKTNEAKQEHEFGWVDSRTRSIGAYIKTWEIDMLPYNPENGAMVYRLLPGHYFCWRPQATRNRQSYGASQSTRYCVSAAERDQQIADYLRKAAKRAGKIKGAVRVSH